MEFQQTLVFSPMLLSFDALTTWKHITSYKAGSLLKNFQRKQQG